MAWLPDLVEFIREDIERHHRPIPGNPSGTMFHTDIIFGRSVTDDSYQELTARHFAGLPVGSCIGSNQYPPIWDLRRMTERSIFHPRKIIATAATLNFDEEVSAEGNVRVPAATPDFMDQVRPRFGARWINLVQPSGFSRRDIPAIVYPSNISQPGFPRLGAATGRVTIAREGWRFVERHSVGYSLVAPSTMRDALIDWFKRRGA